MKNRTMSPHIASAALFLAALSIGMPLLAQPTVRVNTPGSAFAPERQAGQTVRRDTAAWNNEPLTGGPKWSKGDRNSWEEQIKRRQLAQHEDRRIYQ